ncbi:SAM-dependent methyltransferase [Streptomonospora litoralis]|uniref:S-adenosyl methyltransferase n=1 Tax=Streptomonospora litoralis TaxID=2498135 RepID=A0A4P6PUW8_9ACTN|nr:SAM-dependent methyltransferase [Streptomonospora litoralis]QBI51845.1 S-adenosyl methyltransferase [Streptomonospora litoralis]
MTAGDSAGDRLDTSVPHSARVWNYWLGGKDNYAADRVAGAEYARVFPGVTHLARASRAFLARTVGYLAGEVGLRQFLDIGTGLPTADNTHEVAQGLAPESRIVYVDNDPLVLLHAQALLTSTPEGTTDYIEADLRDPENILGRARGILDFSQPVALMLMGILGHVADYTEARSIVQRLVAALPPGSYLVINDGTNVVSEGGAAAQEQYNESGAVPYLQRSPQEIGGFFEGLDPVDPGLVSITQWRPEPNVFGTPPEVDGYGAVARKP